ncbi:hypothetical protein ACFPYI_19205 [Halomarina salina]|uniref:Uncharacterized protein n=1 Tax=Halomarina salina TaxID=1872699 RepID=A0ABD5RSF3_9EURY|nr:hypothetical protein [Halomarina salina]
MLQNPFEFGFGYDGNAMACTLRRAARWSVGHLLSRDRSLSAAESGPDLPMVSIRRLSLVVFILLVMLTAGTAPVSAQEENPICTDDSNTLAGMIEGFIQITTALGVMGLLIVWQADSLMEMVMIGREQKASIRNHKRTALKSAGVLVCLGPLFTVAGTTMNLPIANCVDLIPF